MTHWTGWDALNCLNQSKVTWSWCEMWNTGQANFYPNHALKHIMPVTIEPISQSQPYLTIHYTYEERLEGLSWYEMSRSVNTHTILVWNVGTMHQNFHHPRLKSRSVVTVVEDEFQSPPSPTIHHTYNDTLEGLGCCELPESVQSHLILVWKVYYRPSQLLPQSRPKTHCGSHIRAHNSISPISNH